MQAVTVTLTKPDPTARLGVVLAAYASEPHPQIQDVTPGGLAAESGQLRKKDVIVSINGSTCTRRRLTRVASLLSSQVTC